MTASARWLQEVGDERERLRAEFARKDDESARLAVEKEEIIGRIKLLDSVLTAYGLDPPAPQRMTQPESKNLAGLGLRDAIRAVLMQAGRRLKPARVVAIMRANGFEDDPSKTDLHIRVSNELWRMADKKMISRSKAGYSLKTTNPSGAQTPEGS